MGTATYTIVSRKDGWGIEHDGDVSGAYDSKEAAFEIAVSAASNALKEGHGVTVSVPGREPDEAALVKQRQ
jgi:Uncharacterized protein conserved in bacteria (DUF2188)